MISKYVSQTNYLKTELIESLSETEVNALREDCASLGLKKWTAWFVDNLSEIQAFVAAAPSRKESLRKWKDQELKTRLILGGVRFLNGAQNLMTQIDGFSADSYRRTACDAGFAYLEMRYGEKQPDWPVDWGKSPF